MKKVLLSLLLVCLFYTAFALDSQFIALSDLFEQTDGFSWKDRGNWLQSKNYCQWNGVTCDAYSYVTKLKLHNNNLNGKIPDSIGSLTRLDALDLSSNKLQGAIPETFGALKQMTTLLLKSNSLKTLPKSFNELQSLSSLDLSDNFFSTEFPTQITQLQRLTRLNLSGNSFTGVIPSSFAALYSKFKLQYLDLSGNQLTGFPQDLTMPAPFLQACNLSKNRFRCPIAKWAEHLCNATCVKYFG